MHLFDEFEECFIQKTGLDDEPQMAIIYDPEP